MEIYERIIELRKEHLPKKRKKKSITQNEFGELLGVSRSVIVNIEYNRVPIKDHMIKLICQTFNVNEEWLRNGTEPVFKEKNVVLAEEIANSFGLDDFSLKILKRFAKLSDEEQKKVIEVANMLPKLLSDEEEVEEEYTLTFEELVGDPEEVLKEEKEKQKRKGKEEAS